MSQRYQAVQHFDLGTATPREFTERSKELLVGRGFRVKRRTRRATESHLELTRGNPILAILGANLGLFSRVRVELKVRQSRNEGEEGFRVTLRTAPLQESDDFEESWFTSNHGDRRKMRLVFKGVFELLEAEGLIVVLEDHEEPNRPGFFDPEAFCLRPQVACCPLRVRACPPQFSFQGSIPTYSMLGIALEAAHADSYSIMEVMPRFVTRVVPW